MPVTYACLKDRVGLRERSASLGALVGANFNNDGTALYEAMAALFIAQLLGMDLTLYQQLLVVITSMAASIGAAGIPEAGLVTMTMVFMAVGLPVEYIAVLLSVDWFLDRCRTTINVMGDINVSALLDGEPALRARSGHAPRSPCRNTLLRRWTQAAPSRISVREAVFDLLRAFRMTTVFGNPGSTELRMFRDWPQDFRYVLGLQESVVVAMADGYAQARRVPTLVNLHSAGGVGHALGQRVAAAQPDAIGDRRRPADPRHAADRSFLGARYAAEFRAPT